MLRGCGVLLKRLLDILIFSKEGNHTIRENYTLRGSYKQAKKVGNFFFQVLDLDIAKKGRHAMPFCGSGAFKIVVVFKEQLS